MVSMKLKLVNEIAILERICKVQRIRHANSLCNLQMLHGITV
jgi:hypothetical protein